MKKLYQYYRNYVTEYEFVSQNDEYIFYNRLECKENSKPMKLKIENLNRDLGYGGVFSFDEYNDTIYNILKESAKDRIRSKQMKIDMYRQSIDSLQEDIDECNEFINNKR